MKTFPINVNRTNEMNVGNAEPLRWITKTRAVPRTALLLYIGDSKPTVKKMLQWSFFTDENNTYKLSS